MNTALIVREMKLTPRIVALLGGLVLTITVRATPSPDFGWRYGFDEKGRTVTVTDPAHRVTRLRYSDDAEGQPLFIVAEYPSGSKVTQSFNKLGQRARMTDAAGTVDYAYDKSGRLLAVRREGMPAVAYSYDKSGRIKFVTVGRQPLVEYEYDVRGRVDKAVTPAGNVSYRYAGDSGTVIRTLPNGITTRWTYRPDGRTASIAHAGPGNKWSARYEYSYRADGLIDRIQESTGSVTVHRHYEYDTVGRLVSFRTSAGTKGEYSYDGFGNRVGQRTAGGAAIQSQFAWAGRILTQNGRPCRHDAAGNLVTCDGSEASYSYGDTSQIESASLPGHMVRYRYDGDGRMVGRVEANLQQAFVPDPLSHAWRPLVVQASDGKQTLYLWEGDGPLIAIGGDGVRFMLHDHLGSVRVIANQRGDVIERRDYSPFGEAMDSPIADDLQPGFAGLFFDKLASLYLTRARVYQPTMGRFLQPDPEHRIPNGEQKDLSPYSYCGGDPVNYVDVDGAAPTQFDLGSTRAGLQDMMSRMTDLTSQMRARSQETLSKQQQFASDMRSRQQEMVEKQQQMASDMRARQQDIMLRQRELVDRTREATEAMRQNALDSAVRFRNNTLTMLAISTGIQTVRMGSFLTTVLTPFGPFANAALKLSSDAVEKHLIDLSKPLDRTGYQERVFTSGGEAASRVNDLIGYGRLAAGVLGAGTLTQVEKYDFNKSARLSSSGQFDFFQRVPARYEFKSPAIRMSSGQYDFHQPVIDSYVKWNVNEIGSKVLEFGIAKAIKNPISKDATSYALNSLYKPALAAQGASSQFRTTSRDFSPLTVNTFPVSANYSAPSKVGGIRLHEAGRALANLGAFEGIALDTASGSLVLLSKGERLISLPPLRLDDVVTVFRSVYQYGEAPSVSIDPLSDRKTEALMKVRHGAATANTYVGWVLYESDRLMKAYQFGKDNRTKSLLVSHVPGYRALFGRGTGSANPVWERFWIVPDSVAGERDTRSTLTTFQVPLRVETERMEWRDGKFQTARDPTPSPSAKQFTEWFTKSYNRIADEALLKPPAECGVGEQRVPVFHELRRMALITAIAETLRDQNVPFPAWMRDYPVHSCPVDETTPVMRDVERGEYMLTGGVQLAVPEARRQIVSGGAAPERLARAVEQRVAGKPILSSESFELDGVTRQAVTLPGSGSLRGGANILQHTDLVLPVGKQGTLLALTRQSHSFFDPAGPFGRGWTLDLPQLEKQPVPVRSGDGRGVAFKTAFELTSPLNSGSARFAERRVVPEMNAEMWVPAVAGDMFGLADTDNRFIGARSRMLAFHDGRRWFFDDDGYMVGHSDASAMVTYQRDPLHRIHVIRAWALDNGRADAGRVGNPDAQITLEYLGLQVASVEGTATGLAKPVKAHYIYHKDGRLALVIKPEGKFKYGYKDGLLTSVAQDDSEPVTFSYNAQGQLEGEARPGEQAVAYERTESAQGSKVVVRAADDKRLIEAVQFDKDFRPTGRTLEDGTTVTWKDDGKTHNTVIATPGGEQVTVSDSSDARRRTITTSAGATHAVDFDQAGRATTIRIDEGPTIQQRWDASGRLLSAVSDTEAVLPSYTKSGALAGVMVTPPQQASRPKPERFVKLAFDAEERVSLLEDDSGGRVEIGYDETGYPASIRSPQGSVKVARNQNGQVRQVDTSWGAAQSYEYDAKSENLARINFQQRSSGKSAESSLAEFAEGKITRIRGFDGGETRFSYFDTGSKKGLLQRIVTANDLPLTYDYDLRQRLSTVQIGDAKGGGYRVNYEYDSANRLTGISFSPIE